MLEKVIILILDIKINEKQSINKVVLASDLKLIKGLEKLRQEENP